MIMEEKKSDAVFSENELRSKVEGEGVEITYTKDYGIGMDCHSRFIQVNVPARNGARILEHRKSFDTDWKSLCEARDWAAGILQTYASPPVDVSGGLHYVIESTSVYHCCVLDAWLGMPSVINPGIAGATKRKTDGLDAHTLSIHDLTNIWPYTYVPDRNVTGLRTLLWERNDLRKQATRCSIRINNGLLRFGVTVGRNGSVTGNKESRKTVASLLEGTAAVPPHVNPEGVPEDARCIFEDEYALYDMYIDKIKEYDKKILDKIKGMEWPTAEGKIHGGEMLRILESAPGIGRQTAILWMSAIVDPVRFPNAKAIAAYCGCDPSLKVSAGKVTSTVKRKGNPELHGALCRAAASLVKAHKEPFGKWGYNIAVSSGRWKKGVAAVARKLVVALYHMMLRGEEFSYDSYRLLVEPEVMDMTIDELCMLEPQFRRYVKPLHAAGIATTSQLVHEFYTCRLTTVGGLGKKFYGLVKEFIENQQACKKLYFSGGENEKASG